MLRTLFAWLALACAASAPAVAVGWTEETDQFAREMSGSFEGSSTDDGRFVADRWEDPIRAFSYAGPGWATLDGWMRRDLVLRQWIVHRFDRDFDDALSVEEASSARKVFYWLADANRSGIITPEEFTRGWTTVRGAMLEPYAG
jgi:hypothetical protein